MNTKMFFNVFLKALPFGLGIVLALISIAFTVKIIDESRYENNIYPAVIFGITGFPMLIAGALKLVKEFNTKD